MMFDAIDTLFLSADEAWAAYQRLGLRVGETQFTVGGTRVAAAHGELRERAAGRRGLFAVGLRVGDLDATVRRLAERGVTVERLADGRCWAALTDRAAADLVLVEPSAPEADPGHAFPLRRLDHLAAVAHDLDETTAFWTDVLGVPLTGEVRTPTMVVRQLRLGDAVFELLGPASADSPMHGRPRGLVSLASWEVPDLAAAVAQARAAGFTAPDPAVGVLPGTRTSTIPAAELGGTAMQLLEYV